MNELEKFKKKLIYRSNYRGTKEMDILLGNFVKKYINKLDVTELNDLKKILSVEDEVIQKWYFNNISDSSIRETKVSLMLKNFKI